MNMQISVNGNRVSGTVIATYDVSKDKDSPNISRTVTFTVDNDVEEIIAPALQTAIIRAQAADRRKLAKGEALDKEFTLVAKQTVSKIVYMTADEYRASLDEPTRAALAGMPDNVLRVWIANNSKSVRIS